MPDVELNWATAKVKDGKLTVDLEGEGKLPSEWKQSFETTVALLPGGEWGEVELRKHAVRVSEVAPGSEEKLRHHLESVVEQANAAVRPPESEESEGSDGEGDGPDGEGGEGETGSADARMTESFRAFAEDAEGAET